MNSKIHKKILITGANGCLASALRRVLKDGENGELFLIGKEKKSREKNYFACDLEKKSDISFLLEKIQPDEIYHLAGTFTNDFEKDYASNVLASENLFASVRAQIPQTRILVIGSSAEYGIVKEKDNPVKENRPLLPVNVYGLTKVFQTELVQYYVRMYGLEIMIARPFNIYGSGISPSLFAGKIMQQVEMVKTGVSHEITVDDLSARRDYLSIDEVIKYFQKIMEKGVSGEVYNVGSGVSFSAKDFIKKMLKESGIDYRLVEIKETGKKSPMRDLYASIEKLSTFGYY